ncbi:MAG: DinB family protein [Flavobacteriaceae bacterium]
MENNQFSANFKKNAFYRLDESTRMIEKSLVEITPEELWLKPNDSLNSIGNLMLHLCGNMTQYVISSLGNIPDIRNREEEFSKDGGFSKDEIVQKLKTTVETVKKTILMASDTELLRERNVQGFSLSGVGCILHLVEHYSYHTGQIAFWVKLLKNKSLGFYDGFDLNIKNET